MIWTASDVGAMAEKMLLALKPQASSNHDAHDASRVHHECAGGTYLGMPAISALSSISYSI